MINNFIGGSFFFQMKGLTRPHLRLYSANDEKVEILKSLHRAWGRASAGAPAADDLIQTIHSF